MDAYHASGRPGGVRRPGAARAASEGRRAVSGMAVSSQSTAPPWAAAACLRPLHPALLAGAPPTWTASRLVAQPLTIAASLLLAGGIAVAAVGVPLARATPMSGEYTPVALAAPAGGALRQLTFVSAASAADQALLAQLLAAPTVEDEALLASVLSAPAAAPAAIPAVEFAAEPAAAPPAVSFATVNQLPATAFSYTAAAQRLPAITLADQIIPPPAPPRPPAVPAPQPPPPPGYVQPPGYQDGVPFGGQIGAVPAAAPSRPAARPPATRPSRPAAATVYVVRAGDTLSAIALRFYGNARYAPTIWEANYRVIGANPNLLLPGQRLVLPGIAARPAVTTPLPARGPIAQRSFYTIQPHDYLRWIAERAYGNERLWPEIYHVNRTVLGPDPDLIYPGVQLYIP